MLLTSPVPAQPDDGTTPCRRFGRMTDCITVPFAASEEERIAKTFQPPAGEAGRVYLIRPYSHAPRQKSVVLVDMQPAADLAPMTFAIFDLKPGTHEITIQTADEAAIRFDIRKGEIHYFQYQINQMAGTLTGVIRRLDAQDGQLKIMQANMAAATPD